MRILAFITLPAVVLGVACGGASSTELFSKPAPDPTSSAAEPTEPPPAKDAGVVVVDASLPDADASTPETGSPKCHIDSDCTSGICNWKTDHCAEPGDLGDPCKRDRECKDELCNWALETCSDALPSGSACRRNKECASGSCDWDTSKCV